jgi:hypothetical protein
MVGGHVQKDWHFGKCKNQNLNTKLYWNEYEGDWCGGGHGYILSRAAISLLLKPKNYDRMYNEIYEDKSIGDILRSEKVYPSFELVELKISININENNKGEYIFNSNH